MLHVYVVLFWTMLESFVKIKGLEGNKQGNFGQVKKSNSIREVYLIFI